MHSRLKKKLMTLDDIRGVLLSSKHSGGKYLQIKNERKAKRSLLKQMLKEV